MLQVFVSSTFVDLIAHRDVVLKAIRQSGADAAAMEDLGARDERALDECRRIIREFTDVFVGIYAHRYGFVPRGSDSSIIGYEYREARLCAIPVFAYLIDDSFPWWPDFIDQGDAKQCLDHFKNELRQTHIVKEFREPFELASFIASDLARHNLRVGLSDAREVAKPVTPQTGSVSRVRTMSLSEARTPGDAEK